MFDEKTFPYTDDQIQELVYDFLYDCGIKPTNYQIPDFQEWLRKYNIYLKMVGS